MQRLTAVLAPRPVGATARPLTRLADPTATRLTELGAEAYPEFTSLRGFVDQFAVHPEWVAAGPPRTLAYNSPFVPGVLKYAEVQIPVVAAPKPAPKPTP
jgi:hypothetical protein